MRSFLILILVLTPVISHAQAPVNLLDGIPIRPESRCSAYSSKAYPYPQSVELKVITNQGGIYSPYSMRCFSSRKQTDIEHIVARSEAHDSGLCKADAATKKRFSRDPLNLTLAAPHLNRSIKVAKDAAEWMPEHNQCWYAGQIARVKKKYRLSMDAREAQALRKVLSRCTATQMRAPACAR